MEIQDIKFKEMKTGRYRVVREDGKEKVKNNLITAQGFSKDPLDGYLKAHYFILCELKKPEGEIKYEILDGNHR